MMLVHLFLTQAFASDPCFDLVDRFASDNCLSIPSSFEIDMGDGPVVTFDCDLGNDMGQDEIFAVFSLASDVEPFFKNDPLVCSGGDLWIDSSTSDELEAGITVSWLSWTMYHEWDDDRNAGVVTNLDDWFIEQTIMRLHSGGSDNE
jgi:hypothetical protein